MQSDQKIITLILLLFFSFLIIILVSLEIKIEAQTATVTKMHASGCITFASSIKGTELTISSLENSFQKTVELPIKECVPTGKYLISIYRSRNRIYQTNIEVNQNQELSINTDAYVGGSEDSEDTSSLETR